MVRPTVSSFPVPRLPVRPWLRRARRSPLAWWLCAAAVAAVVTLRVAALDDDAEARRQAWGEVVEVVVAVTGLDPGDVVASDDVTVERWPAAMLPSGALEAPPVGRTVTAPVVAGEALVAERVAPDGLTGVAALIPEGQRAIAVPATADGFGTDTPPLEVGDRVDVLATFDVMEEVAGDPTGTVATAALVVDVGESAVTVAVPEPDAARVAFAVARGIVTLALVGAG